MKKYTKPDFFATEFAVNDAVAACNRVVNQNTVYTSNQTVNCLIEGSESGVFNTASGCTKSAQYVVKVTSEMAGSYDCGAHAIKVLCDAAGVSFSVPNCNGSAATLVAGQEYLIWYEAGSGGKGHSGGVYHCGQLSFTVDYTYSWSV